MLMVAMEWGRAEPIDEKGAAILKSMVTVLFYMRASQEMVEWREVSMSAFWFDATLDIH